MVIILQQCQIDGGKSIFFSLKMKPNKSIDETIDWNNDEDRNKVKIILNDNELRMDDVEKKTVDAGINLIIRHCLINSFVFLFFSPSRTWPNRCRESSVIQRHARIHRFCRIFRRVNQKQASFDFARGHHFRLKKSFTHFLLIYVVRWFCSCSTRHWNDCCVSKPSKWFD